MVAVHRLSLLWAVTESLQKDTSDRFSIWLTLLLSRVGWVINLKYLAIYQHNVIHKEWTFQSFCYKSRLHLHVYVFLVGCSTFSNDFAESGSMMQHKKDGAKKFSL